MRTLSGIIRANSCCVSEGHTEISTGALAKHIYDMVSPNQRLHLTPWLAAPRSAHVSLGLGGWSMRATRFLVCDLTHGNRGAYWEAGFAEGLGIPVIYTCRRDVFEDPAHEFHPHFDAAHWVTVPWDPANLLAAATKLKVTVRATLPAEARLED